MFPLKNRFLTSGHRSVNPLRPDHTGSDYRANFVTCYIPHRGAIIRVGNQPFTAGKFIVFRPDFDKSIEIKFYHLSGQMPVGRYEEGDIMGVTGTSGASLAPHLHISYYKNGVELNPDIQPWDMKPKILILNLDVNDYFDLPKRLGDQLATWGVPVDITLKNANIQDALAHQVPNGIYRKLDPVWLRTITKPYINYDIIHIIYRIYGNSNPKPDYMLRPSAYGNLGDGVYVSDQWVWAADESPLASQVILSHAAHEIAHNFFQLLWDRGFKIKDTTHDNDTYLIDSYKDEYKTFALYLEAFNNKEIMKPDEVKKLYVLAFYREPDQGELTFWTGKLLADFLKVAITDRAKFLTLQS